jgi:hypothetical protein
VALALGLDVGNAKIKLCARAPGDASPRWTGAHLPYDARDPYGRDDDFARGIPAAIDAFVDRREVGAVVAVASHGYSYPTFARATVHLAEILQATFPHLEPRLLSGAGLTVRARDVRAGDPGLLGPCAFTNPVGAAMLARRRGHVGLVLDTGGSTTGIVVLDADRMDPAALADPARHMEHRVRHGKLTWIGAQTTPLEFLAHEVTLDGRAYPIVPRGVPFEVVSSLLGLLHPERARKLSLFGRMPNRAAALRALADAVGLDPTLFDEELAVRLAEELRDRAVARLAEAVRRARATAPERAQHRAIAYGLGARGLGRPALLAAGYADDAIEVGDDHLPVELAEIASVYGACLEAEALLAGP